MRHWFPVVGCVCFFASLGHTSDADALAVAANLQARHTPFGSILDPIFASPASNDVVGYTRCGDSALWTGAYLAAESFHYKATQSPDALHNVKGALDTLNALSAITGDNRLARCMVLASSPYADGIAREEASNAIHSNPPWFWVDNTSRDQIVGAFFGLGVAFDLVDDPAVKTLAADVATRLTGYISRHQWSPNDDLSSTFQLRPEELQMLLQVARHLNPANTVSGPFFVLPVDTGVAFDTLSNSSYFKFSLDYMSLYHLVKLQPTGDNRSAYADLRNYTRSHQNAFFNMIDRALNGPDAVRDAETRALLDQWLQRPRRDIYVDLSSKVAICGDAACAPIPVAQRAPATFLWEVSPFQLKGGGSGVIENAGVDYLLPYWMARYFGVLDSARVQSAAAPAAGIAPGSLASIYGQNLPTAPTLVVTDSTGAQKAAQILYTSPTQINFLVPDTVAPGLATFGVSGMTAAAVVQAAAPGLFSMNGTGSGAAAAQTLRCDAGGCVPIPIPVEVGPNVYATLYGTGIRNRSSLSNVKVTIHGLTLPALYAGPTPGYLGLDQINIALPPTLRGAGECDVIVTIDGQSSNAVTIAVQ